MATQDKTWTWDSSNESFSLSEIAGAGTFSRDTSNGDPTAGSLEQLGEVGRNKTGTGQAILEAVTWETLGVPTGATVNSVRVEDVRTYSGLTAWTAAVAANYSVDVQDASTQASVTGSTLWTRNTSAQDSSWQSGNQSAQTVQSSYQASSTSLDIVIQIATENDNNASAQASGHLDYLILEIDYSGGTTYYKTLTASLANSDLTASIVKQGQKPLTATLSNSDLTASIAKAGQKVLTASLTPAGALVRAIDLVLAAAAATIGPAGSLSSLKKVIKALTASLSPSGAITRQTAHLLSGALTPSAALARATARALSAALSPGAALAKQAGKALAATLSSSTAFATQFIGGGPIPKALTASLSFSASVTKGTARALAGSLGFSGAIAALTIIKRAFTAVLSFVTAMTPIKSGSGMAALIAKHIHPGD